MVSDPRIDRRILRTRESIRDAMINLIEEVGFESIAIKDIANRANINRGTFYLHYHDKFDLLDQTENEIVEDLKEILIKESNWGIEEYLYADMPLPVIVTIFEYFKSRSRIMHAILGLKANPSFQGRMRKAIESNLQALGLSIPEDNTQYSVPARYFISYISAAHMGVIQSWLYAGCQESPEEMAVILSQLSIQGPLRVMREKAGQI
jgi:AcrR family transcriptional regulator